MKNKIKISFTLMIFWIKMIIAVDPYLVLQLQSTASQSQINEKYNNFKQKYNKKKKTKSRQKKLKMYEQAYQQIMLAHLLQGYDQQSPSLDSTTTNEEIKRTTNNAQRKYFKDAPQPSIFPGMTGMRFSRRSRRRIAKKRQIEKKAQFINNLEQSNTIVQNSVWNSTAVNQSLDNTNYNLKIARIIITIIGIVVKLIPLALIFYCCKKYAQANKINLKRSQNINNFGQKFQPRVTKSAKYK